MILDTAHARYILKEPSKLYRQNYCSFILKHRIVQALISMALFEGYDYTSKEFLAYVSRRITQPLVGSRYCEADLDDMAGDFTRLSMWSVINLSPHI